MDLSKDPVCSSCGHDYGHPDMTSAQVLGPCGFCKMQNEIDYKKTMIFVEIVLSQVYNKPIKYQWYPDSEESR